MSAPNARCWSIVRNDGVILLGTTLDRDLVVTAAGYAGTYSSVYGITAASLKQAADLSVNNSEIDGALFDLGVAAIDIEAGLFDEAAAVIFDIDWSDPSTIIKAWKGTLGQWTRDSQGRYKVEFRGLAQALQASIGITYARNCPVDLFSGAEKPLVIQRCGVDKTPYIVNGAVTSVTSADIAFVDTSLGQRANWFTYGRLTWTGGANAGFTRGVAAHGAGGAIQLVEQLPYLISIGDAYTMLPGCNKEWIVGNLQQLSTSAGVVNVDTGVVTVMDIAGTTSNSGSVSVSGSTATFSGDGVLTITNVSGVTTVTVSGSTVTSVDGNGITNTLSIASTTKVTGDCVTKFNNGVNYKGYPWLTGNDTLLAAQS